MPQSVHCVIDNVQSRLEESNNYNVVGPNFAEANFLISMVSRIGGGAQGQYVGVAE